MSVLRLDATNVIKVAQGGEYQNFSWNKKFFIHFFFLLVTRLGVTTKKILFLLQNIVPVWLSLGPKKSNNRSSPTFIQHLKDTFYRTY